MSRNKARLDRAIAQAKALAAAKRLRANPLLAVDWLLDVRARARQALDRIWHFELGEVSEEFLDEFIAAVSALITERWNSVVDCAASCAKGLPGSPENNPHAKECVGFFDVFPGWLELVPPGLMITVCRLLIGENYRSDRRGWALSSWLNELSAKKVEMPRGMTAEAMGAIVRAILDADPKSLGFNGWCAACHLYCPTKMYSAPPPWELLAACPFCGNAGAVRYIYRPENHTATYPLALSAQCVHEESL